jgi:putative DNA primase/helicase
MAELAEMFAPLSPAELAATPNAGASEGEKRPIVPVPEDAPPMRFRHPQHGTPSHAWPYHDAQGRLVGYVCRWHFETADGARDKLILPVTFCDLVDGRRAWRAAGFPEPRPLFGLPDILAKPGTLVVVLEGEKARDAAAELFPDAIATTPPHGAKSPQKADWSPLEGRKVAIWPDHDQAGTAYAMTVVRLAREAGAADVRVVRVPADFPPKWDLADTLPDGWTKQRLRALLDAALAAERKADANGNGEKTPPKNSVPLPFG